MLKKDNDLIHSVLPFFPKQQLALVLQFFFDTDDEDYEVNRAYFFDILNKLNDTFQNMPKTNETQAQKTVDHIAYLHYFAGGCDWWIIEKDIEQKQSQAFGVTRINDHPPELGYISIDELIHLTVKHSSGFPVSVELDFGWKPTRLRDIPKLSAMFKNTDR